MESESQLPPMLRFRSFRPLSNQVGPSLRPQSSTSSFFPWYPEIKVVKTNTYLFVCIIFYPFLYLITYRRCQNISAPDEIIRPHIETYFSIGRSDVEIVDLLKEHYDTSVYGFRYAMSLTAFTSGL